MVSESDFELGFRVEPDDSVWLRVLSSPAGTTGSHRLPLDLRNLLEAGAALLGDRVGTFRNLAVAREIHRRDPADSSPELLGEQLFQAIFQDDIRSLYDESRGLVRSVESRLRIRLRFDLTDPRQRALARTPWEMIVAPGRGTPLGLDRHQPVARQPEVLGSSPLHPPPYPVCITALVSSPRGVSELDLETELSDLRAKWSGHPEVSLRVHKATLQRLQQAAVDGSHVIHFMGHGLLEEDGRGSLLLEDRQGDPVVRPASVIERLLDGARALRLVVLNACSTAQMPAGDHQDGFQSLAPALIRARIPAVVAMNAPISDSSALAFSSALYRSLTAGNPVDLAVTEGRLAIQAEEEHGCEWAIPTLYLSRAQTQLFLARDEPRIEGEARRRFDQGRAAFDRGDFQLAAERFLSACGVRDGHYPEAEIHACLARMAARPISGFPHSLADDLDRRLQRLARASNPKLADLALRAVVLLRNDYFEDKYLRPTGRSTAELERGLRVSQPPAAESRRLLSTVQASRRAHLRAGSADLE